MLRALWVLLLLGITFLGVWLASSLIAFAGGPAELACVGAVLLFPVLPHDIPNRKPEDTVQPVVAAVTPSGNGARWRPRDKPWACSR